MADFHRVCRLERGAHQVAEKRGEATHPGFPVVSLVKVRVESFSELGIQQCRYDEWPHQDWQRNQTEGVEDDGCQVDGWQQNAQRADPRAAFQPRRTFRPRQESVDLLRPPALHHSGLGHQTVTEVVGAGHLPHGLLAQRDRGRGAAAEQPALQRPPPGRRAAHADKVQERSRAEEVQVVRVVVVPQCGAAGRIG